MKRSLILTIFFLVLGVAGTAEAVQISLVSDSNVSAWGPLYEYAGLGDPTWGFASPATATWQHPSWPTLDALGFEEAQWICTAYKVENPSIDSWRLFEIVFDVSFIPETARLWFTSDNAVEVYLNGGLLGADGQVQGPFTDNLEWGVIKSYDFTPVVGQNSLDFIVRNYQDEAPGTVWPANPCGVIFGARVTGSSVPEPGTLLLLGSGLAGLALVGRKRRVHQG